jgi:alpha/beta superfamily hydrolase
VINLIDELY